MSELPSRDEVQGYIATCKSMKLWTASNDAERILAARADGDLLTRAEWEETVNYGAAAVVYQVVSGSGVGLGLMPAVRAVVDAALEGDDE